MSITLYHGDLPDDLDLGKLVAIDTETTGLHLGRDRLCLVQLSNGDGHAHIVKFEPGTINAPNLAALFTDPSVTKIFHYARFDIAIIKACMDVVCAPVYCTRTASKLVRTYTDRHGLRENCRDLLSVDINKQYQSSDWGAAELSDDQLKYAADDVYHLHKLKEKLDIMLKREGRQDLAQACFDFLPHRAALDLAGWNNIDLFEH